MTEVSIIVPCYNEQDTIQLLLSAIHRQTYPTNQLEVIIADGNSTDMTRDKISEFSDEHPDLNVILVENEKRNIPAGLNCALRAAKGNFIIRLDAHCIPAEKYVDLCMEDLLAGKGDNVGGVWEIRPGGNNWIARSIAKAASHPVAVGDAQYRYTDKAGYVDTVPFGSYSKVLFDQVGLFDESLLTNEDYEFNARIRLAGGRIWLNPEIKSIYFARSDFNSLIKQYWRYGYWKYIMLRRYPKTIRLRQALPPVFSGGLILMSFASLIFSEMRLLLSGFLLSYFLVVFLASLPFASKEKNAFFLAGVPIAVFCMHFFWGAGFLYSLIKSMFGKNLFI